METTWDNVSAPALQSRNPSRWVAEAVPVTGVVTYCPPLVFRLTWEACVAYKESKRHMAYVT